MPRPNDAWSIEASGEVFDQIIARECGGDLDKVLYKPKNPASLASQQPQQQSQQQAGGKNVWNKPNPSKTATGQDFFVELRKQVTGLVEKEKIGAGGGGQEAGGGASGGSSSAQTPLGERAGG